MKDLHVIVPTGLIAFALVVVMAVVSMNNYAPKDDPQVAEQQLIEMVLPIVRIEGHAMVGSRRATWRGSGVIVYSEPNDAGSYDTYVLTCNHVVEVPEFDPESPDPWNPEVTGFTYRIDYAELFDENVQSSRKVPGVVVAQSNNNVFLDDENGDLRIGFDGTDVGEMGQPSGEDLALVRLLTTEKLHAVKMMKKEDISKLKLFFKARVVGCSLGFKPYHTFGEITRLEGDYMSVSAPFLPGNSGGAAYLDSTHEFLGITNAGINGAPHLGIIRPLKHIYKWFDDAGYSWLYDNAVPRSKILETINKDKATYKLEVYQNGDATAQELKTLKAEIEELKAGLEEATKRLEDAQKRVDDINKNIENITRVIMGFVGSLFAPYVII